MTSTIEADRRAPHHGRVHRAHPQSFPHPRPETVPWYSDASNEPTEAGSLRFTDTLSMLMKLKEEVGAAKRLAKLQGRPLLVGIGRSPATGRRGMVDTDRSTAVLVFIDSPMEMVSDREWFEIVMDAVRYSEATGIYVCFRLDRTSRQAIVNVGARGTELLECLRRHDAGYPVYGNW